MEWLTVHDHVVKKQEQHPNLISLPHLRRQADQLHHLLFIPVQGPVHDSISEKKGEVREEVEVEIRKVVSVEVLNKRIAQGEAGVGWGRWEVEVVIGEQDKVWARGEVTEGVGEAEEVLEDGESVVVPDAAYFHDFLLDADHVVVEEADGNGLLFHLHCTFHNFLPPPLQCHQLLHEVHRPDHQVLAPAHSLLVDVGSKGALHFVKEGKDEGFTFPEHITIHD